VTECARALWVTAWPIAAYVRHRWAGAWVNSAFRNEGAGRASELIREAVAATRWLWPDVPALGLVTFVDTAKVRPTPVHGVPTWGRTYALAGFRRAGETDGGLQAWLLRPDDMPPAEQPQGATGGLFARGAAVKGGEP
jgi:hypothetical protein